VKTSRDIAYRSAPYGWIATIPAGTPIERADNLPDGGYWAMEWPGMTDQQESYFRNYGFHLTEEDIS
jgi:hypothetical protein